MKNEYGEREPYTDPGKGPNMGAILAIATICTALLYAFFESR